MTQQEVPTAPRAASVRLRLAAISLWVAVAALLVYGISQTAIRAAALFG